MDELTKKETEKISVATRELLKKQGSELVEGKRCGDFAEAVIVKNKLDEEIYLVTLLGTVKGDDKSTIVAYCYDYECAIMIANAIALSVMVSLGNNNKENK